MSDSTEATGSTGAIQTFDAVETALARATMYALTQGDRYTQMRRKSTANAFYSALPLLSEVRRVYREAAPQATPFQARVSEWMDQAFVPSLYNNMTERGDRVVEELLELLQSTGYDLSRVATLIDYVNGRPAGEPAQEVGGVMVTLAGFCWVAGLDMHANGETELARISQPEVMAKIRAKQEAKNALHFDTPLPGGAVAPAPQAAPAGMVPRELAVAWRVRVLHQPYNNPSYWSRWQEIDAKAFAEAKASGAYYEYDTIELQELGVLAAAPAAQVAESDQPNSRYAIVSALEYLRAGDSEQAVLMLESALSFAAAPAVVVDEAMVDALSKAIAAVADGAPGPWETDTTKCDGDYGAGDEPRTGFMAQQMLDINGLAIFDSLNADARAGMVEVDQNDDSDYAWDVLAERNFKAAAAAVNFVREHGAALTAALNQGKANG